jgi:hypothetical protein
MKKESVHHSGRERFMVCDGGDLITWHQLCKYYKGRLTAFDGNKEVFTPEEYILAARALENFVYDIGHVADPAIECPGGKWTTHELPSEVRHAFSACAAYVKKYEYPKSKYGEQL